MGITYRDAGVDIDAGSELVSRIKRLAKPTRTPHVIADIGGFAGLCGLPSGLVEPVLVSGTDGVGTKLKIAFATGVHHTVGIDLVAMCVNDIITGGATPLFFLDYFATGRLSVDVGEKVIEGIAAGCLEAGCALLGGETAELPSMYPEGEYDLAGFAVGVVERAKILDGKRAQSGDAVLAVPSSGLHSNGYSLARRVLLEEMGLSLSSPFPGRPEATVGEVLLTPTTIYAKTVLRALTLGDSLKALCHITGGGLPENLPRVLPESLAVHVDFGTYERPAVFKVIQAGGPVDEHEMRRTFNLGVGLVAVVSQDAKKGALELLGPGAWELGVLKSRPSGDSPGVVFHG